MNPPDALASFRLKRCPACGYDLAQLRDSRHCPECGVEYDDQSLEIRFGRPAAAATAGFGLIAASGLWLLQFAGSRRPFLLLPAAFAVVLAVALFLLMRQRHKSGRDPAIVCLPHIVTLRGWFGRGRSHNWVEFDAAYVRSVGYGRWWILLVPGIEKHLLMTPTIEARIRCNPDAAAALRRNLRARIARAKAERDAEFVRSVTP